MRGFVPAAVSLLFVLASLLAGCLGGAESGYRSLASCDVPQADADLGDLLEAYGPAPRVVVQTNQGDFTLELFVSKVPITAGNFLELASDGFYDNVKFHRVIDGFMIQGGDPNTKDQAKATWGQGGPGYEIPDEFHAQLTHDGDGVLSMANSGPNTGGSQFFITLGDTSHLDYKHAVFGRVAEGMSVVRSIGQVATDDRDRPVDPVVIESMTVEADNATAGDGTARLSALRNTVEAAPGRTANFLVFAKAEQSAIAKATLTVDDSASESVQEATTVEDCFRSFALPADQRFAVVVAFDVPTSASEDDEFTVPLRLTGGAESGDLTLTVRAAAAPEGEGASDGDTVELNYAGFNIYGQLFDTSVFEVADDDGIPKFDPVFQKRSQDNYKSFSFEMDGEGTIDGFSDAARGLKVDERGTHRIAPEDAYPASIAQQRQPNDPLTWLAGRSLLFDVQVVDVSAEGA